LFLGITQAQEKYHTDTLVVFDDVTFEEEIKIVIYPIVGYDTVQTNDSNYTLKPIRIWIDTLIMFNDETFEESVTVHKHYSRNDTIGIDYYPSGEPYSIYKSPFELKYPSQETYFGPEGTNFSYINKSEMYKLNTIDTIVSFEDVKYQEVVSVSRKPCFQLHIGDEKFPMFQTDRYQSLITVEDANAMLNAKNISLVSTCTSQTGTLDFLQIKHRSEDYVAWVNDDKVDYSVSGDQIGFQVRMNINQ